MIVPYKTYGRLEILDLLSCGELCACDLLAYFQFSQPTLSHHMKILVDNELASTRKDGTKHKSQAHNSPQDNKSNISNRLGSDKIFNCNDSSL